MNCFYVFGEIKKRKDKGCGIKENKNFVAKSKNGEKSNRTRKVCEHVPGYFYKAKEKL